MKHSDHGIVRNDKAEDQPADKERARTAHRSDPDNSVSREATRDPSRRTPKTAARRDDRNAPTDHRR